jgi:hypothetical protein
VDPINNPRNSVKGRGRGQRNVGSSQQHNSNCSQKEVDPMNNSRDNARGRNKLGRGGPSQ